MMKYASKVFQIFSAIALSFLLIAQASHAQGTNYISMEKAKEIAFSHAGVKADQVQIKEVELDHYFNGAKYEVKFYSNGMKYDYDIDAQTGKIIKHNPLPREAGISIEKAKQIALSHAGVNANQAYFKQVELDHDWGINKYELEFYANGMKYEYDIDTQTGKVIKFKQKLGKYYAN